MKRRWERRAHFCAADDSAGDGFAGGPVGVEVVNCGGACERG